MHTKKPLKIYSYLHMKDLAMRCFHRLAENSKKAQEVVSNFCLYSFPVYLLVLVSKMVCVGDLGVKQILTMVKVLISLNRTAAFFYCWFLQNQR